MKAVQAYAQLRVGREEEAISLWESVRASHPDMIPALIPLASFYEGAGRHAEATAVVADVRRANPELRADDVGRSCDAGGSPEEAGTTRENLRRAGLP